MNFWIPRGVGRSVRVDDGSQSCAGQATSIVEYEHALLVRLLRGRHGDAGRSSDDDDAVLRLLPRRVALPQPLSPDG